MALDIGGVTDSDILGKSNSHPSPLFDFTSGFVPRKLKDLFRVQEWLVFNSTHIYAALNKLSDYSITDVVYETESAAEKTRTSQLMEEDLSIKEVMKAASRDRQIYGNSFVSVYLPFTRFLVCTECKHRRNVSKVNYKFKWKDQTFRWTCPHCSAACVTHLDEIEDKRNPDRRLINVIRWDPKLIDIEYNPITGQSLYYYTIPKDIKSKVQAGNKHLINTMPLGFLKAIKDDKIFKFAPGQLYHMKVDAPAGIDAQWGFPPLTSTIKQFYYTAALRKANEAIALDYVVPFRVLHPAATPTTDPSIQLSLNRWMNETKDNIKKWRRDPLHMMFSPIPLGVTQMGGDGRALMTLGEVEAAENNILAAMGIPKEFLYGGLSYTGSSVTLRMLENQLLNQTKGLERLMNWVGEKVFAYLGWPKVKMSLTPFKLIDDVQQKQVLLALNQSGQVISNTTLAKVFGYDLEKERKLRLQEAVDESRFTNEVQYKLQTMNNSLANQARAKAQQGQAAMSYDQQQIIAAADSLVQQFMQLDPGTRRSQIESLKAEDFVMYSVVVKRLEEQQKQQVNQARVSVTGGGQAAA